MKLHANRKPLIQYRFKDRMNCVFFKTFHSDHEARLWFERNKHDYILIEFNSMGFVNHVPVHRAHVE